MPDGRSLVCVKRAIPVRTTFLKGQGHIGSCALITISSLQFQFRERFISEYVMDLDSGNLGTVSGLAINSLCGLSLLLTCNICILSLSILQYNPFIHVPSKCITTQCQS